MILLFTISIFILYVVCYVWKLYLFYIEGLLRFEKVLQSFIFRHTHPCFSPLQVLVAGLSCQRGFLANPGIGDYFRWYNSHSTFTILIL